jgi:Uma2 family endonuclease
MVAVPKERFTLEEYIEFDKNSEERWEYFDGVVVSMSGGTLAHNQISVNLLSGMRTDALAKGCQVLPADMRIKVPKALPYRYADIVVVCGPPMIEKVQGLDVLVNPSLIIEILSESTEAYNRGQKFVSYQSIDSFREYLLVAQDRPYITHYVRQADGSWLRTDIEGLDNEIELVTISCKMPLREIYALVDLPATTL